MTTVFTGEGKGFGTGGEGRGGNDDTGNSNKFGNVSGLVPFKC